MNEKANKTYEIIQETFRHINLKLLEISSLDLSGVHVGDDWSLIPHLKDHLEFLAEQVSGLSDNLKDSPPPQLPDEVKALRDSFTESVP